MSDRIFFVDPARGESVKYCELAEDIRNARSFSPYCRSERFYDIFLNIILSLIAGKSITLFDSDFSDKEVISLIGDLDLIDRKESFRCPSRFDIEDLAGIMNPRCSDWSITLFTSGTTGLPKRVTHTLDSLTRFVKVSDKHYGDVWGYAYNPTHMAGLQVFFQALMNLNPMIRLFGLNKENIEDCIRGYGITHISATPTFYRLMLPSGSACPSVTRLTSGGEKFDGHSLAELKRMFPNAKLTNVYASTEAGTLFGSAGNIFTVRDAMSGKVRVVDGELYLHSSLLGESDMLDLVDGWYRTGDLVEVETESPLSFRFVSRKNEMINVGGYKVNPTEVESAIRRIKGIRDVHVYAKSNRLMGNVICADVVRIENDIEEADIRQTLRDSLQEFKIPRVIMFVDSLNMTRTGKISRK